MTKKEEEENQDKRKKLFDKNGPYNTYDHSAQEAEAVLQTEEALLDVPPGNAVCAKNHNIL